MPEKDAIPGIGKDVPPTQYATGTEISALARKASAMLFSIIEPIRAIGKFGDITTHWLEGGAQQYRYDQLTGRMAYLDMKNAVGSAIDAVGAWLAIDKDSAKASIAASQVSVFNATENTVRQVLSLYDLTRIAAESAYKKLEELRPYMDLPENLDSPDFRDRVDEMLGMLGDVQRVVADAAPRLSSLAHRVQPVPRRT